MPFGVASAVALAGLAAAQAAEKPGEKTFRDYCAACHRYDGQEMGEAPPLHASPWVDGPAEPLIKIVLHGVRGRMQVQGKIYDREMPGFGSILADKTVADLLSFVRTTFNEQGEPVSEEEVRRIRERNESRTEYWRLDELLGGKQAGE